MVRTARKRTKEEGGIDLKAFDFVRKHLSGYTEAELIGFGNSIILYAKYLRVPVFQNLQLFPVKEPSEDDKLEQAAARGQVAARRGDSAEQNPWTLDNPLGQEWARAHAETQAQMLQEGIKPLPENRGTAH
ncbi:hypothetical protein CWO90_20310 [Bradyrhizobium sp. Leo121]|nr:hypothetical protein CWO90_20310 [Bradyrhizobium sp. Leo121]